MSASLLLPCTPPPVKAPEKNLPLGLVGSSPRLSFSSYSTCQGHSLSRPQHRHVLPNTIVVSSPEDAVEPELREVSVRPVDRRVEFSTAISSGPVRTPFFVPVEKESVPSPSLGPFDTSIPSTLEPSQERKYKQLSSTPNNQDVPYFSYRVSSASSSINSTSKLQTVPNDQPPLIMPSIFSFFRSDSNSRAPIPRNVSSRSLNPTSSPSPLIRKCNTMVTLSDKVSGEPQVATTKSNRNKKSSRLSFLRWISSSSSQSNSLKTSPSSSHFQCSKRSSGVWPLHEKNENVPEEISPSHPNAACFKCSPSTSRPESAASCDLSFCKLCLSDVSSSEIYELRKCHCKFCAYCLCVYTTMKIREGETRIDCPDASCRFNGELTIREVEVLVGKELLGIHMKFKIRKEVEVDPYQTWCPKAGCANVVPLTISKFDGRPQCCVCPTCATLFCASCSDIWHPGRQCYKNGIFEVPINDMIKRCPNCKVPIERDAGCAQMQCKKCKHVFCWYCLSSLEDDFLLRHYDKGACKNKLGHSRASVFWHRAQVVVIFAGFGLLLFFTSPLLLLIGPCLLCRSCRNCADDDDASNSDISSGDYDYDSGL